MLSWDPWKQPISMLRVSLKIADLKMIINARLNFKGFLSYCERYSKTINAVSNTFGAVPKMEGEVMQKIAKELEEMCPLEDLEQRRKWRDNCLTQLSQMKSKLED